MRFHITDFVEISNHIFQHQLRSLLVPKWELLEVVNVKKMFLKIFRLHIDFIKTMLEAGLTSVAPEYSLDQLNKDLDKFKE